MSYIIIIIISSSSSSIRTITIKMKFYVISLSEVILNVLPNKQAFFYWKCFWIICACDIDKDSKRISGEDWIVFLFVGDKPTEDFFNLLLFESINFYLMAVYKGQPTRITASFTRFVVQRAYRVKVKGIWGVCVQLGLELYRK